MKSFSMMQGILLILVVVILVFVVTLTLQYIRTESKTPVAVIGPGKKSLVIEDKQSVPAWEWRTPGHCYFPFNNKKDEPVTLYLKKRGCSKCSSVDVTIGPDGWKGLPTDELKSRAEDPNLAWQPLVENQDKSVEVPPQTAGVVRMTWKSEELGTVRLSADLLTEGREIRLEVTVNFVEALRIDPGEERVEPFVAGEGGSRELRFTCWSSTRDRFTLKAQPTVHRCFVWGQPTELTEKERRDLAERLEATVKCGYTVPLIVHERLGDDAQLDLGPFTQEVSLKAEEPDLNAVKALVSGSVSGDISVVPRIDLGRFPASTGTGKKNIIIRSSLSDIDIRLDRAKTPDFLEVQVSKSKEAAGIGGKPEWVMEVKALPGTVNGAFPDRDRPGYEDCAILLNIHKQDGPADKPWRRIRIPVSGNATSR